MRAWVSLAGLCAACYHPASERADCAISCATAPCPGDLVCGAQQLCHAASDGDCPGGSGADAAATIDAPPDGPPGTTCYGDGLMRLCVLPPMTDLNITTAMTIDTSSCANLFGNTHGTVCVMAARSVTIAANVTVQGTYPLLLLGTDALTVASGGTLEAASHTAATNDVIGAGARATCSWAIGNGKGNTGGVALGASGGAGGSFGAAGGGGGASNTFLGASAQQATSSTSVVGGCAGGSGGVSGGNGGPAGGAGGGAIYLVTGGTLSISGTINASGAGGHRAGIGNGGAGGGAGGFVGLDAKIYSASTATIFAVGGGGSCGGSTNAAGSTGPEATGPAATGACADTGFGGSGGTGGVGAGGPGGVGSSDGASLWGGGGGGGGGAGIIAVANLAQFPAGVTTIQPNPIAMP